MLIVYLFQVLYHQLGQDDVEESIERQGRKRILRRATMDKNLELSIHNRRLFLVCLAVVEVPGVLATITTIHWAIDYKVREVKGLLHISFILYW